MLLTEGLQAVAKIREELAWLKATHPEKMHLIAAGQVALRIVEQEANVLINALGNFSTWVQKDGGSENVLCPAD